ncbi:isoflavone reductase family protein [Corynespora cassiicola Philippines]|uniref:Isoflavone reductase family protein n=1 Tax=Corynespora cassiicola Philippines TaxID=1448308 RepID=A0A2T2P5F0_CORCC|nr:isoflavone reductase family protein [Corynespora cassiicola Philippines]
MSALKNIVWVGAGKLGLPILKLALATGKYKIKLLVRNPVDEYSNLPTNKISVHQVDYRDHPNLVHHLQGQDAIIVFTSLLPGTGLDTKQIALINAAIDAGVKYFIPSEWALDTAGIMGSASDRFGPTLPTNMVLAPKRATHNYLLCRAAEHKIHFAAVYPGLEVKFLNLDFKNHTAILPDEGINPFPASTMVSVSKAVMSLFDDPSKISNRFYHIADGVLTQKEVVRIAEEVSCVTWKTSSFSIEAARLAALESIEKGTYAPADLAGSLTTPLFGGIQVWTHVDNKALGVEDDVDLREEMRRLVRERL